MFVRTAGERDLEAIRDLLVETWHATYDAIYGAEKVSQINDEWHSPKALRARLDKPRSEFLVADDGVAIAGVAYAEASGETALLKQLYVRPSMQGRGVGGLLLDEVEGSFPEARKLQLEVEEANGKAVTFYVAQGFAKVGMTSDCGSAGSGIAAAIYERPIHWVE